MKKYYAVPENQLKLRQCIEMTKVEVVALEAKIKDLEQYITVANKAIRATDIHITDVKHLDLKLIGKSPLS